MVLLLWVGQCIRTKDEALKLSTQPKGGEHERRNEKVD